jgi:hypothetical protein
MGGISRGILAAFEVSGDGESELRMTVGVGAGRC